MDRVVLSGFRNNAKTVVVGEAAHRAGVARLVSSFRAIPDGDPVRLAKKTSNLFRARPETETPGLDTSGLEGVISIDPVARTAEVQGMCTYENLVDATLEHELMPFVVPQLKTITLGGAVSGMGIEASSFRLGLPHESVLEMDILTGSGDIVTARPDGDEHERSLYRGFPNSYGSLGYAVRLRIELEPVNRFVELRHLRLHSVEDTFQTMNDIVESGEYEGENVDFLDGVVFSADEAYLVLGRHTDEPGPVSDYTGSGDKQAIYYRSLQHPDGVLRDRLTIRDFIWRWDTDWFWCSRAFGTQNPHVRRFWPKQLLRSSFYWKIVALDRRWNLGDRIGALKGEGPRERVVQDVEVVIDRAPDFLHWFLRELPISPIWLCPLRLRKNTPAPGGERPWPLYPLEPDTTYVNFGFWSSAPIRPGERSGAWNRDIEDEVSRLGGHKSLYSESFYDEETFARLYGGDHAERLKAEFDPDERLKTMYDKAVRQS